MEFHGSPSASIGAEYELQLLDAASFDLTNGIQPLLKACRDSPYVGPEINQYTVEISSKVCGGIAELDAHLHEQLSLVNEAAHDLGMRLAAAGTHPFGKRPGKVTPQPRFRRIEQRLGFLLHTVTTWALHVHVGIGSADEAMRLMNRLRPYLPLLLALSASSPLWHGHDMGFASYRVRLLLQGHAFHLPPPLPDWAAFELLMAAAYRAGMFESLKDVHWHLRPRPDFGTLELRIMDAQPTLHDTMGLVALVRALAEHLKTPAESHLPALPHWLEQENEYRAARSGLAADYIIDLDGNSRPLRDVAADVLDLVEPTAAALGEQSYLDRVRALLRQGTYDQRLRALYRQTRSARAVAQFLAERFEEDLTTSADSLARPA